MDEKESEPRYARNLMELLKYPAKPVEDDEFPKSMKEVYAYDFEENGELSEERKAELRTIYYELPEE